MNITSISIPTVKTAATNRFGQNESAADRLKRMKAFWSDKANAVLIPVGKLLATVIDNKGTRLADIVASDPSGVTLSAIQVEGVALPLAAPVTISLTNCAQQWGCPACKSAHGSGVYPSKEVDNDLLADGRWFFNPATKRLHVISDTCYQKYTVDLIGRDKMAVRFTTAPLHATK